MSLLLEALKKAELAKQGKQPAEGEAQAAEIEFESAPPSAESASPRPSQRVITRGQLPDISQPLEILSEDLPSSAEPAEHEPTPLELAPAQSPLSAASEGQRKEPIATRQTVALARLGS